MPTAYWSTIVILGAAFGGCFAASVALVRIGIAIARRIGFVAQFNSILGDSRSVAMGGGVSFGVVVIAASAILWHIELVAVQVPLALLAALLLGLLDDIYRLDPFIKLAGQVVAAAIYLSSCPLPWVGYPIVAAFLVATQNAWNLVDVMDGLAGSISVMAFLGVGLVAWLTAISSSDMALIAIATAGAVAGFLIWNRYPARVFMGDTGSLMLGLLFGILIVEVYLLNPVAAGISLLNGLIPLFEIAFLIVERSRKRIPIMRGSRDHFALRLRDNGFSESWIIRRVSVVAFCLTTVSVLLFTAESIVLYRIVFLVLSTVTIIAYRYFHSLNCASGTNAS